MNTTPVNDGTVHRPWMRLLYIVLFAVMFHLAELVLTVVVVVQYVLKLVTGEVHQRLRQLGQNLAAYVYEIIVFLTSHTDAVPYPFGPWPHWSPGEKPQSSPD